VARELRSSSVGTAREVPNMFGLGILGTIILIVLILWLLGVIG
jgi:hypothetical protein